MVRAVGRIVGIIYLMTLAEEQGYYVNVCPIIVHLWKKSNNSSSICGNIFYLLLNMPELALDGLNRVYSPDQVQLSQRADMVTRLMDQANVVPRINPLILSIDRTYLDLTASPGITNKLISFVDVYVYNTVLLILITQLLLTRWIIFDEWEDTTMFSYTRLIFFTKNVE